jgi:hypothetical protein
MFSSGEPTERRIREWSQLAINFVLVVVGIIAICIYHGQLQVMKGQLGEIVKQYPEIAKQAKAATEALNQSRTDSAENARRIEQQLIIAGQQAKASQETADITRAALDKSTRSFKQEQRPYLWAISFNIANPAIAVVPGKPRVCGDVHVVNTGKTPAIGVKIHRYATFGASAEQTIRSMKVPVYRRPDGDMLGSSGDKWGTAVTEPIDDPKTEQDLLSGKASLYLYGVVQYFDIFGDYHETGYCSFKLPDGPFMTCDFGNWFDKRAARQVGNSN